MDLSTQEHSWFALRIRTRHERIVASALYEKGYEVFLPLYYTRRQWSDRIKEMALPLFPGYLFCRFDMQKRLPVLVTPGILHVVGIGKAPVALGEHEIAAIQSIVASRLRAEPWPFLEIGQRLRIERGPLMGVEGILVARKKPFRLVVSVTLLQRSVAVEINHDWVTRIESLPASEPLLTPHALQLS